MDFQSLMVSLTRRPIGRWARLGGASFSLVNEYTSDSVYQTAENTDRVLLVDLHSRAGPQFPVGFQDAPDHNTSSRFEGGEKWSHFSVPAAE